MNKTELVKLYKALKLLGEVKGSAKFSYGIVKNQKIISDEINILSQIEEDINATIVDFTGDRNELIKEIGKPDGNGSFFIDFEDIEATKKFQEELEVLTEKYKEQIDVYNEKQKDFEKLLEEKVDEIEFYKMNINDFPCEGISPDMIESLIICGVID